MKYNINVWIHEEARDFILKNIDIIDAALNFIFWQDYSLEIEEFPSEVCNTLEKNELDQVNIKDLILVFRNLNKVNVGAIDIIIISRDLYHEGREYIFAATHIPTKTIVISLYRLMRTYSMDGFEDENIIRRRVFKELLHELGHLLGLEHCSNSRCVMSFSPDLKSLDDKLPFFCSSCVNKLKSMGYKVFGPADDFNIL